MKNNLIINKKKKTNLQMFRVSFINVEANIVDRV